MQEVLDRINSCQKQLVAYKDQLTSITRRKTEIIANLKRAVEEAHPCHEALLAIFNRKIKRTKKKSSEVEDDSDSDEDDLSDDDDGLDDGNQQEICPPGCEQALYDEVCMMREQRLDQEEVVAEVTKSSEQIKKEKETLSQKMKRLDQSLQATQLDIQEFQKQKQSCLNEIKVIVMMRMHQIEYLVDGHFPTDFSSALIFSNKELTRLRDRIEELGVEKKELRKAQHELKRQHLQLVRDKQSKENGLLELDARAYDVQVLKFGQVIDLELLDKVGPAQGADDLKAQLKTQEDTFSAELTEWDRKIAARTEELASLTTENTAHLHTVAELTIQQKSLESGIRDTRKNLFNDPIASRKRETAERDHLVQIVNAQAKEIKQLSSQIAILRRKDTSVYS